MKKFLVFGLMLVSAFLHSQNWQTINNVNHVYDIEKSGDSIYFSSWGGVVHIQGDDSLHLSEMQELQQLSTGDGLVSNDIRNLSLIEFSQSLWMGSSNDGISILSDQGLQTLGTELGLPSLRVNKMIESDSRILVGTAQGLAVFYYLSGVNFPLMLHQYNVVNTGGGLANNNITDMLLADNSFLFLAHDAGVSYVHLDSLDTSSAWHSLNSASPIPIGASSILSANADKIAVATSGVVYYNDLDWEASDWQEISTDFGIGLRDISAFHLSSDDQLWIAYGLWDEDLLNYTGINDTLLTRIDTDTAEATHWLRDQDGFGYNFISTIKEYDGSIYLGSWGDGIARYRDQQWEYFNPNNIAFPKITLSKADQNNALWFCSGIVGDIVVRKGTLGVSAFKDGSWHSLQTHNSLLHSNNILGLEVDSRNRKWFGAWDSDYDETGNRYGLTIYDDANETWQWLTRLGLAPWDDDAGTWGSWIPDSPRLITNTIAGIYRDLHNNMLVLCYNGGVSVINEHDELIGEFEVPGTIQQKITTAYHNGRQYFIGTDRDNGLSIWNHDSIPETDGPHWVSQIIPELQGGTLYGVASVETPYSGWQHFIASGSALYMWDEYDWYRYDVYIKRQRYNFATGNWENDTLYYADEERLFGSIRTVPNAIYGDPFGRIWIGSLDHGLSMYDPMRERFTNYYQDNSPLLSNQIISLGYDPLEGRLLIGTSEGLNTLRIGRTVKPETDLNTLKAFPNPYRPDGTNSIQIVNLPADSMPAGDNECNIYSSAGSLVIKLEENPFSRFEWDGRNKAGDMVSSGTYFFVVSDADGKTKRGKFAIIR
jgi:hypothetical protein